MHITDTGPGIAPEHREKIFESNFSTKVNSDDPLSGTGIGLAYCKKIIESYGGSIKVNSELGKGTTFILTFWSKSTHNELEQFG
jgi:signal transduction histidine kinase